MKVKNEEQIVAYLGDDDFGKLLNHLMEQQDISAAELCEGLCSESIFSKIRSGEVIPDKMLRDRLLGRLGLSDERCENLLEHDEYVEWQVRWDIIKAVKKREVQKARELLEKYAVSKAFEEKIAQQFYYAMEIQLRMHESVGAEQCAGSEPGTVYAMQRQALSECLEQAVKLTVPRVDESNLSDLKLDLQELNLVLEYEKYSHSERFAERCREILQYIENATMDERSRAKIYPKAVWYLCGKLEEEGTAAYPQILRLTKQAVEILRNTQRNHYLWEILLLRERVMENIIEYHRAGGNEKRAEALMPMYRENSEWKQVIQSVYELVQYPLETNDFCYLYVQQELHDIKDVARRRREMLGLSREKLNAGAFDKKTLIRLEAGQGKPRMTTIKTLFARLNLSGELQRTDVVATTKKARDLVEQLVKQTNNFELEKEQETLAQLEKCLDMGIPLNRQFVKAQQAIILHGGRKCNREKAYEVMKEALECTIPLEKIQKSKKRYLTGGEITCLYNMAIYAGNTEINEFHKILLEQCEEYEQEGIVGAHIGKYAWILTSIARVYSNMREYEKAMELSVKAMIASLDCGRLNLAEQNVDCISCNQMQLQEKSTSEEMRCDRKAELEVCIGMSRFNRNNNRVKMYANVLRKSEREN